MSFDTNTFFSASASPDDPSAPDHAADLPSHLVESESELCAEWSAGQPPSVDAVDEVPKYEATLRVKPAMRPARLHAVLFGASALAGVMMTALMTGQRPASSLAATVVAPRPRSAPAYSAARARGLETSPIPPLRDATAVRTKPTPRKTEPRMVIDVRCAEAVACNKAEARAAVGLCLRRFVPVSVAGGLTLSLVGAQYAAVRQDGSAPGAQSSALTHCLRTAATTLYGEQLTRWPALVRVNWKSG